MPQPFALLNIKLREFFRQEKEIQLALIQRGGQRDKTTPVQIKHSFEFFVFQHISDSHTCPMAMPLQMEGA